MIHACMHVSQMLNLVKVHDVRIVCLLMIPSVSRMVIQLRDRHAFNTAVVKLIEPEDRMAEWDDNHEGPNIDASIVAFQGKQIVLPEGLQLQL